MKDKTQVHSWREGEDAFIRTHLILEPMPTIEEGGKVPTQVMVLPWGANELKDAAMRERFDEPGTLEVNTRTATEVTDNFTVRNTDFFVNLDHMRGKAYGWIEAVSVVEGEGIYLSVDWTAEGTALVMDRAYRYSSVEVILDASAWMMDGSPAVVVAVVGMALTNNPAVVEQAPIAFQTLTAALSASDGREFEKRQNTLGETEEKGDRMASDFWKTFLSRAVGKELEDEVDAATETAKLSEIRENHVQLTADLEASASKVSELAEQLETANKTISEMKVADFDRIAEGQEDQVDAALAAGKIGSTQVNWAKANFDSFLSLIDGVEDGTFGPPRGRVVTDKAIASTDAPLGDLSKEALDLEIKAYMAANDIEKYHVAAKVVKKAHAAAGKEV
jgi:hypothetical protein